MYRKQKLKANVGKREFSRRVAKEKKVLLDSFCEGNSTFSNFDSLETCSVNSNSSNTLELFEACDNFSHKSSQAEEEVLTTSDVQRSFIVEPLPQSLSHYVSSDNESRDQHSDNETGDQHFPLNMSSIVNSSSKLDLTSHLRQWAIETKCNHLSLTKLLKILAPLHPQLPLDSRSLLNTPTTVILKQLENGEYCHIGIAKNLKKLLPTCCKDRIIHLSINIDGLPLFSSSTLQFWPISAIIRNFTSPPFAIGIFCGRGKPLPLSQYLNEFIEEYNSLKVHGFLVHGRIYNIKIDNFICDYPAKAFLKCVKSHGGYSSCDKCWEPGEYIERSRKVILKGINALRRTDGQFLKGLDEEHHIGRTPLLDLNIGLVSSFAIDYMHAVCLGVVKRLLVTWISGNLTVRLRNASVQILSNNLVSLRPFIPLEFNRKPRSLSEIAHWKATEFRTFLLYLGPWVLKHNIDKSIYQHFLLLHAGISMISSSRHIKQFGYETPKKVLNNFVTFCEFIYGLDFYVYNTHILCHLVDEVERFGPLDSFSAFPFENFLGMIKRFIRSPQKPLQQIYRRLEEISFVDISYNSLEKNTFLCSNEHDTGPTLSYRINKQYKKIVLDGFSLCTVDQRKADAYCLSKEYSVIEVHNVCKTEELQTFIIGKQFLSYDSLYERPINSKDLDIYIVKNLSNLKSWDINQIVSKCMVYPTEQNSSSFVAFPLLHI